MIMTIVTQHKEKHIENPRTSALCWRCKNGCMSGCPVVRLGRSISFHPTCWKEHLKDA